VLDHWARYRRYGIQIALGTDTYPRDMIMQMRAANLYGESRFHADLFAAPANEVFDAATTVAADFSGAQGPWPARTRRPADIIIVDSGARLNA